MNITEILLKERFCRYFLKPVVRIINEFSFLSSRRVTNWNALISCSLNQIVEVIVIEIKISTPYRCIANAFERERETKRGVVVGVIRCNFT